MTIEAIERIRKKGNRQKTIEVEEGIETKQDSKYKTMKCKRIDVMYIVRKRSRRRQEMIYRQRRRSGKKRKKTTGK